MSSLTSIRKILALKCSEAARMISDGLDQELSFSDRLALKMHLISCGSCRKFRKQVDMVRKLLRTGQAKSAQGALDEMDHLSAEARARLEKAVVEGEG